MGFYTDVHIKVTLIKELPEDVFRFLNEFINNKNYDVELPEHLLFSLQRGDNFFYESGLFGEPMPPIFRKDAKGYHYLELHASINHAYEELIQFTNWITPYVAGRKKKQYIGYWRDEAFEKRDPDVNIYVNKQTQNV